MIVFRLRHLGQADRRKTVACLLTGRLFSKNKEDRGGGRCRTMRYERRLALASQDRCRALTDLTFLPHASSSAGALVQC